MPIDGSAHTRRVGTGEPLDRRDYRSVLSPDTPTGGRGLSGVSNMARTIGRALGLAVLTSVDMDQGFVKVVGRV